ncbi:MAG: MEDS domain-containing protein [Nannocystis sp.]|nr:MEDS domain-containing protein [Nannocystis sp.]
MQVAMRPSGLSAVGSLPWGTHFCQFYGDRNDLADSLVPYFKAGIDANEKCLWVTSAPLRAEDAKAALRQAVPDLDARIQRQQVEILDHDAWYTKTGRADAEATLRGWADREQQALSEGFAGLRLTGNTYWVERSDWQGFVDYESRVSATFAGRHIIGLCSYCLSRCQAQDVLDVVANHQFALTRREGAWHMLESASMATAKSELARLNEVLEQRVLERTLELQRAVQARDEFLSVASHELRTPITSIQLYVQGIARAQDAGSLSPEQAALRLRRVNDQCGRLDKLVNNLLDVSRSDGKEPTLRRESLDLAELVSRTADRFADELARARCRVSFDAPEPVLGSWDAMRIEQAVSNLLQNVIRYAPASNVAIEVMQDGPDARLAVRDDGPGVAPADHARVFERFAQAESPHFKGGFGLGLWIVKQVAEAHGGSVTLASEPGAGAAFVMRLPRG